MELVISKLDVLSLEPETSISETLSSVLQRLFRPGQNAKTEKSFSLSEVSDHCHCNDCWIVIGNHVYDVTSFLDSHPGGFDVMMEHAGRDATIAFYGAGHGTSMAMELLQPLRIGVLVQEDRVNLIGSVSRRNSHTMWTSEGVTIESAK